MAKKKKKKARKAAKKAKKAAKRKKQGRKAAARGRRKKVARGRTKKAAKKAKKRAPAKARKAKKTGSLPKRAAAAGAPLGSLDAESERGLAEEEMTEELGLDDEMGEDGSDEEDLDLAEEESNDDYLGKSDSVGGDDRDFTR